MEQSHSWEANRFLAKVSVILQYCSVSLDDWCQMFQKSMAVSIPISKGQLSSLDIWLLKMGPPHFLKHLGPIQWCRVISQKNRELNYTAEDA